jgi:hypothetical protein
MYGLLFVHFITDSRYCVEVDLKQELKNFFPAPVMLLEPWNDGNWVWSKVSIIPTHPSEFNPDVPYLTLDRAFSKTFSRCHVISLICLVHVIFWTLNEEVPTYKLPILSSPFVSSPLSLYGYVYFKNTRNTYIQGFLYYVTRLKELGMSQPQQKLTFLLPTPTLSTP